MTPEQNHILERDFLVPVEDLEWTASASVSKYTRCTDSLSRFWYTYFSLYRLLRWHSKSSSNLIQPVINIQVHIEDTTMQSTTATILIYILLGHISSYYIEPSNRIINWKLNRNSLWLTLRSTTVHQNNFNSLKLNCLLTNR